MNLIEQTVYSSLKTDGAGSARQLALRLRRGQSMVGAACRALLQQGRIRREGGQWVAVAEPRTTFEWTRPVARRQAWITDGPLARHTAEARQWLARYDAEWLQAFDDRCDVRIALRMALTTARVHEPALFDQVIACACSSDPARVVRSTMSAVEQAGDHPIELPVDVERDETLLELLRRISAPDAEFDTEIVVDVLACAFAVDVDRVAEVVRASHGSGS